MAKEIKMFNTYFGDCFILKNDTSLLLVDFGIHHSANVPTLHYTNKSTLIQDIADDIERNYKNPSVLITHFHTDHICGLIHMYNSKLPKFQNYFPKIYIPNIWGNPFIFATNLLDELVLRIQLKKSGLPYSTASLLDLIDYLCINASHVELLNRGISFEDNKYLALWPPKNDTDFAYESALRGLDLPNDLIQDLHNLSRDVCAYVVETIETGEHSNPERIVVFRTTYDEILSTYENQIQNFEITQKLNELAHRINIVFHDKEDRDENALFTGDAETSQMQIISVATDYPLHSHYTYIKIPHHGTPNHYFDFTKYKPEYILIPNGEVNGHNGDSAYMIDKRYGNLASKHNCSNSNNCSCCNKSCRRTINCNYPNLLIYPLLSRPIL